MIYNYSRFTNTNAYYTHKGNLSFKIRERFKFNLENAKIVLYREGDRLDLLSYRYYGTTQLWWAILDANPTYRWEGDIPYGASLVIPEKGEVIKCLQY